MADARWDAVDGYFGDLLLPEEPALEAALEAARAAGLPQIQVSGLQGKLLNLLARSVGARRILEIGTLAGYSAIWLARALPDGGRLVTLEVDPEHAAVARANFERAGVADRVTLRLGSAVESLPALADERVEPFDLVFIDADKENYPTYLDWSIRLCRAGALIVADNVVRGGAVIDASSRDVNVQGVRRFNEALAADPRVDATAIQTVGSKGYDGLAIALVTGP